MNVKLLTEHHLEFPSLKRGCLGSSESTLVKMSNCWKSHSVAQSFCNQGLFYFSKQFASMDDSLKEEMRKERRRY